MPRPAVIVAPKRKPRTLDAYLSLAVEAHFPLQNQKLMARIFRLLSARRTVGEGWVSRQEVSALWETDRAGINGSDPGKRNSGKVTNGMDNLRQLVDRRLGWLLPHFSIEIESDPPDKATRYRLKIARISQPWDFVEEEAPQTSPQEFHYRYGREPRRTILARVWAAVQHQRHLEIEAMRESPQATWSPPSYPSHYTRVRDDHFISESKAIRKARGHGLRPGELWGITEVHVNEDRASTSVRILATRTTFEDLFFLKRKSKEIFKALPKQRTFGQWLGLGEEPREGFCPPRDALCVAVLVVAQKPVPTVFVTKPKVPLGGSAPWEVTAAGAACSSHLHYVEVKPELGKQVENVVFREIGLPVREEQIRWLGFARSRQEGDSSVLALVESPFTVAQIEHRFQHRRERDDVEHIEGIPLQNVRAWWDAMPLAERTAKLELGLALLGIYYGHAKQA